MPPGIPECRLLACLLACLPACLPACFINYALDALIPTSNKKNRLQGFFLLSGL
jgi:hypothetical protein